VDNALPHHAFKSNLWATG